MKGSNENYDKDSLCCWVRIYWITNSSYVCKPRRKSTWSRCESSSCEKHSRKQLHIEENGLQERLNKAVDEGFLTASTTPVEADVFIVAVPSPINPDKTANLEYVRQATASIVPYVKRKLSNLESTVPPKQ